jgi:hypothetical protein
MTMDNSLSSYFDLLKPAIGVYIKSDCTSGDGALSLHAGSGDVISEIRISDATFTCVVGVKARFRGNVTDLMKLLFYISETLLLESMDYPRKRLLVSTENPDPPKTTFKLCNEQFDALSKLLAR